MAEIIGYEPKLLEKITCRNCTAIVQYKPSEVQMTNRTDEGRRIEGLNCPGCGEFLRTNP